MRVGSILLVVMGLCAAGMSAPPAQAEESSPESCGELAENPVLGTEYSCQGPDDPVEGDVVGVEVPTGAVLADVVVIGGGGGASNHYNGAYKHAGGNGARVEATLDVENIDSLLLTLAGGGHGYWFDTGNVAGSQNGGWSGTTPDQAGKYGTFGSGGHGHRYSANGYHTHANATGGGMSAIVDSTDLDPGEAMSVDDVLVIAGGGGGAGTSGSGGDGAAEGDGEGGAGSTDPNNEKPAQGGSAGSGGVDANGLDLSGAAFVSSAWGAGGEHTQIPHLTVMGGTGGAGYGGGAAGKTGGGGAGGSFVAENATEASFSSASNGGDGRFDNDKYRSAPGGAGSVTITFFGAPGPPQNLLLSGGLGEIDVSWSAPVNDGGSAITDYEVEYSTGSSGPWLSWESTDTSTTITGLGAGTEYYVRVRAVNGFAAGSAASSTATPVESTDPPGIPVGVEVMPGDGVLSLQWSEPAAGGAPISDFEYSVDGGQWASLSTTGSSADISADGSGVSLVNGQEYGVRVRARNANGSGDASSSVRQTPGVPLAPGNASGSWEESDFTMSWSAPNSNGSPITEYQVSVSTVSSRTGWLIARSGPGTYSTSSTAYSVTGLSPQSSYTVTITPRNGHGWGLSTTMSIGSSSSDTDDVDDQTPPAIIQQVPLPMNGTCEDVRDQAFRWQTAITGGWGRSWARWRNNGLGGPICTRMLVYDNSLPGWRLAS